MGEGVWSLTREVTGYLSQNNNTQAKTTERFPLIINSIWSSTEQKLTVGYLPLFQLRKYQLFS